MIKETVPLKPTGHLLNKAIPQRLRIIANLIPRNEHKEVAKMWRK